MIKNLHQQSVGRLSFIYAREGQADDEGIPGKGISSVGSYVIFVSYVLACYVACPRLCSNIFKERNCWTPYLSLLHSFPISHMLNVSINVAISYKIGSTVNDSGIPRTGISVTRRVVNGRRCEFFFPVHSNLFGHLVNSKSFDLKFHVVACCPWLLVTFWHPGAKLVEAKQQTKNKPIAGIDGQL